MLVVSAVPAGAGQGVVCLQVLSLSPFHTEMGEMFSVLSLVCSSSGSRAGPGWTGAALGPGWGTSVGQDRDSGGSRGIQETQEAPGAAGEQPGPGESSSVRRMLVQGSSEHTQGRERGVDRAEAVPRQGNSRGRGTGQLDAAHGYLNLIQ